MRYLVVFYSLFALSTFSMLTLANSPSTIADKISGDVRLGYFNSHRTDRDSSSKNSNQWRLRVRAGIESKLSNNWKAKLSFAGRLASDQEKGEFVWDGSIPNSDGLKKGQATFDQAFLQYQHKKWSIKFGRLQTKFELEGVAKKSLDRNESPNTDITWTDGVLGTYISNSTWKTSVILQRNLSSGPTNVQREPLNFSDSGSRVSTVIAIEHKSKSDTIVQKGFNISYLPSALMTDGSKTGRIDDYLGLTAKTAAAWKIGPNKMRFLVAGELGYAPNTPTNAALKIDGSGDADGKAIQMSANIFNFIPNHSFGLVVGNVGGGWLLSPDFRNNNTLMEARYKWQTTKKFKLEARLRQRKDLKQLKSTNQKRKDFDYYIRATYKL